MTDFTKKESAYFIFFAISALAILLGILSFWSSTQESCWDKNQTEQTAIQNCEGEKGND
jgi:hypothetical protein